MSGPIHDLGGGISTSVAKPPAGSRELQHGGVGQITRALAMGSYFLMGALAINLSQVVGTPLYLINRDWYNAWIAFTKQSFGLLITSMTQYWAPTTIRISGDKTMRGQLLKTVQGNLYCDFPERLVFISNHQIYTDWLYIWWLAYTAGMHGRIYIVLKESLRRIPVIGWGMQFSKFIFLKRNWEKDKPNLAKHLSKLNNRKEPMWLTLFPEGTNLAPSTRKASAKWAAKNGMKDMRHQLLPRTTGLHFMLQELRHTVDYIYDCTIAYEGVPRGQYAQDIFTLRACYAGGRGPKSVNLHFRRFKLSSIPLDDHDKFANWLLARWIEKDNLLESYLQNGRFPADTGSEQLPDGKTIRGAGHLETIVRVNKWYEFMQAFAPIGLFSMILYTFYGALPRQMVNWLQRQSIQNKIDLVKKVGMQQLGAISEQYLTGPSTINAEQLAFLKKAMAAKNITINQETIQKALDAGFFKPKNGLPPNKKPKRLAITNQALGQVAGQVAAIGAAMAGTQQKPGLTPAQKRARTRQRQMQQQQHNGIAPQQPKPQVNGTYRPPHALSGNKKVPAKPLAPKTYTPVKKPSAGNAGKPAQPFNPATKKPIPKPNRPPQPNNTQKPVLPNANGAAKPPNRFPPKKLPPKPASTDDTWSTTTGTTATRSTIPTGPKKLELRANNGTIPPNGTRPVQQQGQQRPNGMPNGPNNNRPAMPQRPAQPQQQQQQLNKPNPIQQNGVKKPTGPGPTPSSAPSSAAPPKPAPPKLNGAQNAGPVVVNGNAVKKPAPPPAAAPKTTNGKANGNTNNTPGPPKLSSANANSNSNGNNNNSSGPPKLAVNGNPNTNTPGPGPPKLATKPAPPPPAAAAANKAAAPPPKLLTQQPQQQQGGGTGPKKLEIKSS